MFLFFLLTSFVLRDNIPTKFSMIEARFSSVAVPKARQPGTGKGSAAEGGFGVCRSFAWASGKYPLDCHSNVKRYHGSIRDRLRPLLCMRP